MAERVSNDQVLGEPEARTVGWGPAAVIATMSLMVVAAAVYFILDAGLGTPGSILGPPTTGPSAALTSKGLTWVTFKGTSVPVSTAGPHNVVGDLASGFDHSPAGAVLAAIHISTRARAEAGPAVLEATIREQVNGTARDALLAQEEAAYRALAPTSVGAGGGSGDGAEKKTIWAYRLDGYSKDHALVQLVTRSISTRTAEAQFTNTPYTLWWVDGDWRLQAPLGGTWLRVSSRLSSLPNGYLTLGS